jgi:DNA-binding MarR family transcriptional regulator
MKKKNISNDYIAQNCACFNVRKAARAVTQFYDSTLKPSGLRATQFTLLVALSRRGKIGVTELADKLVMERTTLTRNLKPLQKQGLIEIAAGSDRRTRSIFITEAGQKKLAAAIPYWQQAQEVIAEGLGNTDFNVMLSNIALVTSLSKQG